MSLGECCPGVEGLGMTFFAPDAWLNEKLTQGKLFLSFGIRLDFRIVSTNHMFPVNYEVFAFVLLYELVFVPQVELEFLL